MANFWWTDFNNAFDSSESAMASAFSSYLSTTRSIYFYEFVSDSVQDIKAILIQQAITDTQIHQLAYEVMTKAQAVPSGSEDYKWTYFKNSWSTGLQPAIQVIIDKERLYTTPATLFSAFAARSQDTQATNILALTTTPSDFWTPFINYFQTKGGAPFQTGWSTWLSNVSGDYKLVLAELAELITHVGVVGLADYTDFNAFKTLPAASLAATFNLNGASVLPYRYLTRYFAKLIRQNLDTVFDGYYANEDQQEQAFINLFRPELQNAIQDYIDTLISKNYISSFSDLAAIPGIDTVGIERIHVAATGVAQEDQLTSRKVPLRDDPSTYFTNQIGDVWAFDMNADIATRIFLTYAGGDWNTELSTLINASTGGWSDVMATEVSSTTDVTAKVVNTPFEIRPVSIYATVAGYANSGLSGTTPLDAVIGKKHTLFLAIAQMILNDAKATNVATLSVLKTLNGKVSYERNDGTLAPAVGSVTVTDIDDPSNPIALTTAFTDKNGYFSISYPLPNAATTSKNLRFAAKDVDGNVLNIITDDELNFFTGAADGTFEGGTPPNYTEWNLDLGTDIHIGVSEDIGPELQDNYDFSSDSGGWYTDFPQTTLATGLTTIPVYQGSPLTLYTENILTVGNTYLVSMKAHYGIGGTATLSIYDSSDNLLFTRTAGISDFNRGVEIVATTEALKLTLSNLSLSYFSVKSILEESNYYSGSSSAKFYYDNTSEPAAALLFAGNDSTLATVTANTDYIIEGYVRFLGNIVETDQAQLFGLYLKPSALDFTDLSYVELANGANLLQYEEGQIRHVVSTAIDSWFKITTRFNSGSNTSLKIGTYLLNESSDYPYYDAFSFFIDNITWTKAEAVSQDVTIQSTDTSLLNIYAVDQSVSEIYTAVAQVPLVSQAQVTNVFPANVHVGDLFVLDLDHKSSVSFKATAPFISNVTAGLTAAITAETSDVTIVEATAPDSTHQQVTDLIIADVHIGAEYKFVLNGVGEISFTATTTSVSDVVDGIHYAINAQTADMTIAEVQAASQSVPQIIHITPNNIRVGAKYVVQISANEKVEYDAATTSVANFVGGLVSAINGASGTWTGVVATSGGSNTYVIITAKNANVSFDFAQVGGLWKSVSAADDFANNQVVVTANAVNTPFVIQQIGGQWKAVYATDETTYLTVTGDSLNAPFTIYASVVPAAKVSTTISDALSHNGIILSNSISQSLLNKGVTSLNDILQLGGLKNNLDGLLTIVVTQKATSSLPEIVTVTPGPTSVGNFYELQINTSDTVTYVSQDETIASVVNALVSAINIHSGNWTHVMAAAHAGYFTITYNSNNVAFTIAQVKAADDPNIQKLDAIASLYSVAASIGYDDTETLQVISSLIDAGFTSALSITQVNKENFITTINAIIGDFNASRVYELAAIRQEVTNKLINQYLPHTGVYDISKTGINRNTITQLNSIIEQRCACEDCETAVSPLAYLTDLINYVTNNLYFENVSSLDPSGKVTSTPVKINIPQLTNYFYQDFTELPASCNDITNLVCQLRVAVEVMRRYLAVNPPTSTANAQLQSDERAYVNTVYQYFLSVIGTSYDEVRMIVSDADKASLALRLGIDYDANPNYLDKLFIPPQVLSMASWSDYKTNINGNLQVFIDKLNAALAGLSPSVGFSDFATMSASTLGEKILGINPSDAFKTALGNLIKTAASKVSTSINALSIPNALKETQKWSTFIYNLDILFSPDFRKAFEVIVQNWTSQNTKQNSFDNFSGKTISLMVTYLDTLNTQAYDFWTPFSEALLSKIEDFSLSELDIEELFGMQDSRRDVYSEGAKINDGSNLLTRWNLRGVSWGQNTDLQGYVYLGMDEIEGVINFYRDASKTDSYKVGVAFLDDVTAKYVISEYNDSGLTGELDVTGLDASANIYISAVPLLLSWRLNALRYGWRTEDQFSDAPIVDPDLIGTIDIVYPYDINTTTPTKPIDFWQKRQDELTAKYTDYDTHRTSALTPREYGNSGDLNGPYGVALDNSGNAYFGDTSGNRIQKLASGTFSTLIGSGLSAPKGILWTADGKLIVVDSGNHEIKQFADSGGSSLWNFGTSGSDLGTFTNAVGIALSNKNDLFVTDNIVTGPSPDNHTGRIQRFTLPYDYTRYTQLAVVNINVSTAAATTVKQVTDVIPSVISAGDTIKLTLQGTGSVSFTSTNGTITQLIKGLIHAITYASPAWSSVNVVDQSTYLEFTATSVNTAFTLSYDNTVAFASMDHVATDSNGNRYLPDKDNSRVLKLTPDGLISKVIGTSHQLSKSAQVLLRFNDGTGTSVRDTSGNSNIHNGTVSSTGTSWVADTSNAGNALSLSALALDGASGYVTIASSTDIDAADAAFRTVEIWFKATNKDNTDHQVIYRQGDGSNGMNIYIKSGLLIAGSYGTAGSAWSNFISTNRVQSEVWHHVVVIFNNTPYAGENKFRAFLDGVEFLTPGQGGAGQAIEKSATAHDSSIGALVGTTIQFSDSPGTYTAPCFYFDGIVDDFRIWNRALEDEEISSLYTRIEDKDGVLYRPGALALDKSGAVYVADPNNYRVVKFDSSAVFVTKYGEYGTGTGEVKSIAAIALDSTDNSLYVADSVNNAIQKFNDLGSLYSINTGLNGPSDITVNQYGILYVADKNNNAIKLYDKDGTLIDTYTTYNEGSSIAISFPSALTLDSEGRLVFFDSGSGKLIQQIDKVNTGYSLHSGPWNFSSTTSLSTDGGDYVYLMRNGTTLTRVHFPQQVLQVTLTAGSTLTDVHFNTLSGIACDADGNLWVADKSNNRILKLTPDGLYINDIGKSDNSSGTGAGEFNAPEFVTVDETGNLYVSDTGNNRIQKFDSSGEFLCKWEASAFSPAQNAPAGISVNSDRTLYVAQRGSNKALVFDSMQGISAAIYEALGIRLKDLLSLAVQENQGIDISDQLTSYNLETNAFRQLISLIAFADRNLTLLAQQLADFYNILVRTYKLSQYATWKTEEETAGLSLSQDYFILLSSQEEQAVTLVNWRSTVQERINWVDTLNARVDQEGSTKSDYAQMLSDGESELIIQLRDILITASDFTGNTLLDKAQDGSDKLLIDLLNTCCEETTRVSMALEVLQNIMFGLKNGLISDAYPNFSFVNPNTFDEEWSWMGSYTTWKSAQMVFLYPENLLLPSYVNNQSYGFQQLINNFRANSSVTVQNARDYVADYYDYIDDIRQMNVKATAVSATFISDDNTNLIRGGNKTYKDYLYLIGQGGKTRDFYFATMDATVAVTATTYLNSSWTRIDAFDGASVDKVISLKSVTFPGNQRFLILFALVTKDKSQTLSYAKYDLQQNSWSSDLVDVDIPDFDDGYNNVAGEFRGIFIDSELEKYDTVRYSATSFTSISPTSLYVTIWRGYRAVVYAFNDKLTSLQTPTDTSLTKYGAVATTTPAYPINYTFDTVYGMFFRSLFYVKRVIPSNPNASTYFSDKAATSLPSDAVILNIQNFQFPAYSVFYLRTEQMVVFYISQNKLYYRIFPNATYDTDFYTKDQFLLDIPFLPDYVSIFQTSDGNFNILCHLNGQISIAKISNISTEDISTNSNTGYSLIFNFVIDPYQTLNFPQSTTLVYPDPVVGPSAIFQATANVSVSKSDAVNYQYIQELYYFVPMLTALTLQKQGNYEDALSWFRLVYDYTAANQLDKLVYYGLYAESDILNTIDDFETTSVIARINNGVKFSIVSNPDPVNNPSSNCGLYLSSNFVPGGISYALPSGINIDDPSFTLDVRVDQYQGVPLQINIDLLNSTTGNQYTTYTDYVLGDGWKRLTFPNKAVTNSANRSLVNQVKIRITASSYNSAGQKFYIDNFKFAADATYTYPTNWLSDPLNPHTIAAIRPGTYTHYTVIAIAQCLNEFGDNEFTQDTIETVARARLLYEEALRIMENQGLGGVQEEAVNKINGFDISVSEEWEGVWQRLKLKLYDVEEESDLDLLLDNITLIMSGGGTDAEKLKLIVTAIDSAVDDPAVFRNIQTNIANHNALSEEVYMTIHSDPNIYSILDLASDVINTQYLNAVQQITGVQTEVLLSDKVYDNGTVMAQLKQIDGAILSGTISLQMITGSTDDLNDNFLNDTNFTNTASDTAELTQSLLSNLKQSLAQKIQYDVTYKPSSNLTYCVPANPVVDILRYNAQINLYKIRSCRNIAGDIRELSPFSTSISVSSGLQQINGGLSAIISQNTTLNPSPYRYSVLIDRAKQLVQIAQQIEASMLAALEKLDTERYNQLKAKQDLSLAKAGVTLQNLKTKEAEANVQLAELQKERAQIQYDHYSDLLSQGMLQSESDAISYLKSAIELNRVASTLQIIGGALSGITTTAGEINDVTTNLGSIVSGVAQSYTTQASVASLLSSINSLNASYQRNTQDWTLQKDLAQKDIAIGNQQITIAQDDVAIAGQETQIAQMQADNAQATIDFLTNKFTNAELYDWMSGVLQKVYSYFLQQATSVAKLAASQLAFERQRIIPGYIQSDYWQAPIDNLLQSGAPGQQSVDRKGLTGAERLLQDITQLDEYAFENDPRLFELTKTISLATLSPLAFEQFKSTGVLNFQTTLDMFDQDFPGHYARQISSVSTSVIALVSPIDGIKATLSNTGVSRIVVQNNSTFQKIQVKRTPESVALTASFNATGLFNLSSDSNKLNPFEKTGVEAQWTFSLPQAANLFDFQTIADVLIAIQYTALGSDLYRSQVIKTLNITPYQAVRPYTFKNQFADQWYDLNNPAQTATPMTVSFTTSKTDFPANLQKLEKKNLLLYFVASEDLDSSSGHDSIILNEINNLKVTSLSFTGTDGSSSPPPSGPATAINGVISTATALSNASAWFEFQSGGVDGTWTLQLPPDAAPLFTNGYIVDMLFVITYDGNRAEWPK